MSYLQEDIIRFSWKYLKPQISSKEKRLPDSNIFNNFKELLHIR